MGDAPQIVDGTTEEGRKKLEAIIGAAVAETRKHDDATAVPSAQTGALKAEGATPGGVGVDWDTVEVDLSGLLGLDDIVETVLSALEVGDHVVLLGPPGTGKTELAERVCEAARIAGLAGYAITTATAEWSTFDTIGGYMPNPQNPEALEFQRGIVTESIQERRWLVIDELNRADIDKAFGELFTVLSGKKVTLPFRAPDGKRLAVVPAHQETNSNETAIAVDPDWRMIATMNTFDKASLFQMSFAFMRRFAFVDVPVPGVDTFDEILSRSWPEPDDVGWKEYRKAAMNLLRAVFLPTSGALAKAGTLVGPAIPISVVKYLRQRLRVGTNSPSPLGDLIPALRMYLLPQLEGAEAKHEKLVTELSRALYATERESGIDLALSLWTGWEQR
jgi:5-methylcytosine-specific restriction protein B